MAGRAGRAGQGTLGESVLVCKPSDLQRALGVMTNPMVPLVSCLQEDKQGLQRLILVGGERGDWLMRAVGAVGRKWGGMGGGWCV